MSIVRKWLLATAIAFAICSVTCGCTEKLDTIDCSEDRLIAVQSDDKGKIAISAKRQYVITGVHTFWSGTKMALMQPGQCNDSAGFHRYWIKDLVAGNPAEKLEADPLVRIEIERQEKSRRVQNVPDRSPTGTK